MAKRYTNDELEQIRAQFEEMVFERTTMYLLVDKQVTSRRGLLNALKGAGVEQDCLIEAGDALDALAHAGRNRNPFVVITDSALPDGDVAEMIEKIRNKEGHERDAFVLYTAETKKAKLENILAIGVTGLLKKPMQPKQFIAELKTLGLLE